MIRMKNLIAYYRSVSKFRSGYSTPLVILFLSLYDKKYLLFKSPSTSHQLANRQVFGKNQSLREYSCSTWLSRSCVSFLFKQKQLFSRHVDTWHICSHYTKVETCFLTIPKMSLYKEVCYLLPSSCFHLRYRGSAFILLYFSKKAKASKYL